VSDSRLQEIVTKAVVGRAERRMSWSHTVPAEGITGVYGVHVTDATVAVKESDGKPLVDVIVDCDLWCGTIKHTKVMRCTCRGTETVGVRTVGQVIGDSDMSVRLSGPVRATGVSVADGQITLSLEADVIVEVSALSRMWVKAYDLEDDVLDDLSDDYSSTDSSSGSSSGSEASSSYSGE
jgi:hypothetical protein